MAGKKIRDDLEGVTFVYVGDQPIELRAGDEVPKGAKVGDHLLATKATKPDDDAGKEPTDPPDAPQDAPQDDSPAGAGEDQAATPPDGRSSRDAWFAWAKQQGVDVADDADKDTIRAAVAAATQQQ